MAHAADVVGYDFKASRFCPDCIIDVLPTGDGEAFDGWALAAGAAPMSTEDNLGEIADAFGINRMDERSFDSSEFPKVIFRSSLSDEVDEFCEKCGAPLEDA